MRARLLAAVFSAALIDRPALSQTATGTIDNFDCVNDTGQEAEGFEIDIEDISPSDLTREFPSNFSAQPYVNRFGIPTVTAGTAADGHPMVSIVWAASWNGTQWVAQYGNYVYLGVASGNGVKYVAKPTATQGDSCWLLGQGANYANSGCDHFGLSFTPTATPHNVQYHWLIADPANPGHLVQSPWNGGAGPVPPAPSMVYVPAAAVGQPAQVQAVAEADPVEPGDPQFGQARWAKVYTAWVKTPAQLDALQKNLIPLRSGKGITVTVHWSLLQQPPAGQAGEREDQEDDNQPAGVGTEIHRFEYYAYTGKTDPETGEVICGTDKTGNNDCIAPLTYKYTDPVTGKVSVIKEQGKFLGAHMEAVNAQ